MAGSLGTYIAQVDRVLGAGQALFPVNPAVSGTGGTDDRRNTPTPPGQGAFTRGVGVTSEHYRRNWQAVAGLDTSTHRGVDEAERGAQQGRHTATRVRDTARSRAAAIIPAAGSPAGMRLLVSNMDERLAAMQHQLVTAKAQNRVLAARLQQLAAGYRMAATPRSMNTSGFRVPGGQGGGAAGRLSATPTLRAFAARSRPSPARADAASRSAPQGRAAGVPQGRIALSDVSFAGKGMWPGGRRAIRGYLEEALDHMGIGDQQARANWMSGMMTIADHESTYRTDAINLTDSNAHGPQQSDGGPLHATRGPWQVMPETFARYHQPGTSVSIWDPVANACASMNYQIARYGVDIDGHNQRALVAQANPGVRRGY